LVEQAEAEGWLDQIQPYDLKAPRGDRSGVIVEPLLTDQWYVKIAPLLSLQLKRFKMVVSNLFLSNTPTCIWRG
jgi:valyl-tRNA synthetase